MPTSAGRLMIHSNQHGTVTFPVQKYNINKRLKSLF